MKKIMLFIITIVCLYALVGCSSDPGKYTWLVENGKLDKLIAWGPDKFNYKNDVTYGKQYIDDINDLYEGEFYYIDDIENLGLISDDDFEKIKNYHSGFKIYFGIKDEKDVILFSFYSNKDFIFESTLPFKFLDLLNEMQEISGIEMTDEYLNDSTIIYKGPVDTTIERPKRTYSSGIMIDIKNIPEEYTFEFYCFNEDFELFNLYK